VRGIKAKILRRQLNEYDQRHPVYGVIRPRTWYAKAFYWTKAKIQQIAHGKFGRNDLYPAGKKIRLYPSPEVMRHLKRNTKGKPT
jgi:hypothetical protein